MENTQVENPNPSAQLSENVVVEGLQHDSVDQPTTKDQENGPDVQKMPVVEIKPTSVKNTSMDQENISQLDGLNDKAEKSKGDKIAANSISDSNMGMNKADNSANKAAKPYKKGAKSNEVPQQKTQTLSSAKQSDAKNARKQARATARTEASVQNITQSQENLPSDEKSSRNFILDSMDHTERKSETHELSNKENGQGNDSPSTQHDEQGNNNQTHQTPENSNELSLCFSPTGYNGLESCEEGHEKQNKGKTELSIDLTDVPTVNNAKVADTVGDQAMPAVKNLPNTKNIKTSNDKQRYYIVKTSLNRSKLSEAQITSERDENFHKLQFEKALREKTALEKKLKQLELQLKDMNFKPIENSRRVQPQSMKNLSKKEDQYIFRKKSEEVLNHKADEILMQKASAFITQIREEDSTKECKDDVKECSLEKECFPEANNFHQNRKSIASLSKLLKKPEQKDERQSRRFSSHDLSAMPLYKQKEQINEEVQMKELERRKKILAERRELYKPFKDQELVEFEKKYQHYRKAVESKKKREKSEDSMANIIEPKKYESKLLNQVLEYDNELKTLEEKKEEARKMLIERKLQYAKAIRDLYLPKLSKNRRFSEVQESVKNLIERAEATDNHDNYSRKKPGRVFKLGRQPRSLIQIEGQSTGGEVQYLDEFYVRTSRSKESKIERDCNSVEGMDTSKELTLPKSPGDVSYNKKFKAFRIVGKAGRKGKQFEDWESSVHRSYDEKTDDGSSKKSYPNYISELKKKREELDKKGARYKKLWERNLRDDRLTYAAKVTYVLENIKSVEEVAKEREAWIKKAARVGSIDLKDEQDLVDKMYVDSIKAKIEVLGKFRKG